MQPTTHYLPMQAGQLRYLAYENVKTRPIVLLHATGSPLVTKSVPIVTRMLHAGSTLACDLATGSSGISSGLSSR